MRRPLLTPRRRAAVLPGLLASLLAVLLVGLPAPALAHGSLTDGSPGPGDEVAPGVTELRLDLDELEPGKPAYVAVLDADDRPLPVGEASATDGRVCARVEALEPGVHTVAYDTASSDGDRITGRYSFEVVEGGAPADPGSCAAADLAEPGEARTIEEMQSAGLPAWALWLAGGLAVAAAGLAAVRVVRDRRATDDAPSGT